DLWERLPQRSLEWEGQVEEIGLAPIAEIATTPRGCGVKVLEHRFERRFDLADPVLPPCFQFAALDESDSDAPMIHIDLCTYEIVRPAPQLAEGAQRVVETGDEALQVGDVHWSRVVRAADAGTRRLKCLNGAE